MNIKHLMVAAALVAMPTAAHAVSLDSTNNIVDGDFTAGSGADNSYDISANPFFWNASFNGADVAGEAEFDFTNLIGTSKRYAVTFSTINQGTLNLGGVTVQWLGGESVFTPGAIGTVTSFTVATFIAAGGLDTLLISWGDPTGAGRGTIDVSISAVPLPPAAVLLVSGLLGLGALARRKTKKAVTA